MSRLVRCNRCGTEGDVTLKPSGVAVVDAMAAFAGVSKFTKWTSMVLSPLAGMVKLKSVTADLCEDCTEVLVEQFLVGGAVAPITQPLTQVVLPHEPMTDCQLVWNPGKGRFLCYHEDPELYHALILDNAQNVAEGVPEKKVAKEEPAVRICSECGCTAHRKFGPCSSTGCGCKAGIPCGHIQAGTPCDWNECKADNLVNEVGRRVDQMVSDVITAGVAHAVPQRLDVPGQIMPPACGAECDPKLGNHTNVLGTCLNNPDTFRAVVVVCPICKSDGSLGGILAHMGQHGYAPDYHNHQWVDKNGYDLDGRLISQQGEDLTEAYSPQEPAPVEGADIPQQRDSEE